MRDLDFRHKAMGDLSAVAGERSKEKRTEARAPENRYGCKGRLGNWREGLPCVQAPQTLPRGVAPPFLRKAGTHPVSALSPQPRLQFSLSFK